MKFKYALILLIVVVFGCSNSADDQLVGKWEINEFTVIRVNNKTKVSDANELKEAGSVWNMKLSRNGEFKQEFNMRSLENKMEVETGSWSINQDSLKIVLVNDTVSVPMNYTYKIENNLLVLKLTNANNKNEVICKFERK